jgi:hypothetical protein
MNIAQLAAAKPNFVARAVNNELVLVPLKNQVADMTALFNLNEVGQFIWNQLSEDDTIDTLTAKICDEYEVDANIAKEDLTNFLEDLANFILND